MDPFSFERIHYRFTIYLANLLWIHYLLREFTGDSLIDREFTLNLLSFSWIQYVPIICFANLLWIHYLLREFTRDPFICRVLTLNLLFLSRIHSQFIIFVANPLSIHYLFREFSMDPLIFSRIHFEFTISFAYTRWIHYVIRQFATLSVSRSIHYYFFRKFTLYLLSFREITMDPSSVLWIHYLFLYALWRNYYVIAEQ